MSKTTRSVTVRRSVKSSDNLGGRSTSVILDRPVESTEAVALELFKSLAFAEGERRREMLDLYAECLMAVRGERPRVQRH